MLLDDREQPELVSIEGTIQLPRDSKCIPLIEQFLRNKDPAEAKTLKTLATEACNAISEDRRSVSAFRSSVGKRLSFRSRTHRRHHPLWQRPT